jgi:hypothetical protein
MPSRKLHNHLGFIIEAATVRPQGLWLDTALTCRKRQCRGHVGIQRLPDTIDWRCQLCDDSGSISDWEGSRNDISEFADDDAGEPRVTALLSQVEFTTLWSLPDLRSAVPRLLAAATFKQGRVAITGSRAELKFMLEFALGLIEQVAPAKRETVYGVLEYLEAVLD